MKQFPNKQNLSQLKQQSVDNDEINENKKYLPKNSIFITDIEPLQKAKPEKGRKAIVNNKQNANKNKKVQLGIDGVTAN